MPNGKPEIKIVVVIPVYKPFSQEEKTSFLQCIRVLHKFDLAIVKPATLELQEAEEFSPQLVQISFDPKWFKSIYSYNRLVLSQEFYQRFASYDYMLIYQLDAYVFEDRLMEWAHKGYDYIGAPWLPESAKYECKAGHLLLRIRRGFNKVFSRITSAELHFKVGNGGFSLRKISTMLDVTKRYQSVINDFLSRPRRKFQEDVFLCLVLSEQDSLRVPDFKEALGFAFEMNPKRAYQYTHSQLPFGCHDWYRKKNWEQFWKHHIRLSFTPRTK